MLAEIRNVSLKYACNMLLQRSKWLPNSGTCVRFLMNKKYKKEEKVFHKNFFFRD